MPDRSRTYQDVVARQERVLRLAERDYGLTLKLINAETDIPIATLTSWKRDTMMPLGGFVMLCTVIPDCLTSLLLEPADKHVTSNEPTDGDECALARDSAEYNVTYLDATDEKSESGRAIGPRERARLNDIHRRMKARKIAA